MNRFHRMLCLVLHAHKCMWCNARYTETNNKKTVTEGRGIPYQTKNQHIITSTNALQDQPNPDHERMNKKVKKQRNITHETQTQSKFVTTK